MSKWVEYVSFWVTHPLWFSSGSTHVHHMQIINCKRKMYVAWLLLSLEFVSGTMDQMKIYWYLLRLFRHIGAWEPDFETFVPIKISAKVTASPYSVDKEIPTISVKNIFLFHALEVNFSTNPSLNSGIETTNSYVIKQIPKYPRYRRWGIVFITQPSSVIQMPIMCILLFKWKQ